uniref:Uncharacterized protein n=1 Tax=Heterorhabditis bacteriophora TaxID=37862 RepID=A0A1I7WR75_HETBA
MLRPSSKTSDQSDKFVSGLSPQTVDGLPPSGE